MKVAIASEGKELSSAVSDRAGRAPFYLIFEDGKLVEAWQNPFSVGGGGAGFGVAEVLRKKGVNIAVAAKFGPNMKAALQDAGIEAREMHGTVEDVLSGLA